MRMQITHAPGVSDTPDRIGIPCEYNLTPLPMYTSSRLGLDMVPQESRVWLDEPPTQFLKEPFEGL